MLMKVKLDEGAFMPEYAHELDAGLDLKAREHAVVRCHDSYTFDTGVHICIPAGYAGFLKSKSGLNVWNGILSDGLIDAGYTGSIHVKLYNHSPYDFVVYPGDKISQLVIKKIEHAELELVDEVDWNSERGNGGFGSTGK